MKLPIIYITVVIILFTILGWVTISNSHGGSNELSSERNEKLDENHVDKGEEHGDKKGSVELTHEQLHAGGIVINE